MSVKRYRLCLVLFLIAVIIFGVVLLVQMPKEENSYKEGTMVQSICEHNKEEIV